MKKLVSTFGLLTLMLIVTSFTTPNETGGGGKGTTVPIGQIYTGAGKGTQVSITQFETGGGGKGTTAPIGQIQIGGGGKGTTAPIGQ